MDTAVVDGAVTARAREAMAAARAAEFAVLCSVREIDAAGVVGAAGYGSLERLVQDLWRVDLGEARRLVRQSRLLCGEVALRGDVTGPALAATAKAAESGGLDRGHVRVIDEALRHLGRVPDVDPQASVEAEAFLVGHAATLTPRGLARVAARLIAALDPDGVAPKEEAEPTDELRIGRRRDGSLVLKGRFRGRADIDLILETFDALSGRAGSDDHRQVEQRYAETLLDLCAHAGAPGGIAAEEARATEAAPEADRDGDTASGAGPVEGSGVAGSPAPTRQPRASGRAIIGLTIPLTWLREQIGHGLLDTGQEISPADARRLACDAGIIPLTTGTRSEPLDVGRLSYTVPESLRRALHHRDCQAPGFVEG